MKDSSIYYIGGLGYSNTFDLNEISVFDTTNLKWLTMTTLGDSISGRSGHSAVLSAIVPSPLRSGMALNNNVYLFNTQNYTWIKTFDALNINGTNSKPDNKGSDSLSLGAKIGIVGIGVGVVAAIVIYFAWFFIYNKVSRRDNLRHFTIYFYLKFKNNVRYLATGEI
ncbi:20700_t:CDS:2, partial [Cetraspora pellucida]